MLSRFIGEICSVGGCANGATRHASFPCQVEGRAGELEIFLCDEHQVVPPTSGPALSGGVVAEDELQYGVY
jgi:hypothetical protein